MSIVLWFISSHTLNNTDYVLFTFYLGEDTKKQNGRIYDYSSYKRLVGQAAFRELEKFGIFIIYPTIGDEYDCATMESYSGTPKKGVWKVKRVFEFGYFVKTLQSAGPQIKKRALVELDET